ncbi:ABC transporter substrate-binding protein [Natrinema sp. SYSU A 869]|uniref:ABC transporter substrate-binding protein n=1 Tax=Natrinema sp. SYSU A 869 TaxID=2871694 RepID=UPI001CA3ABE0|nr:ABC transporter substrate-binding protein [Natrinema sp. SYSU A 869]
MSDDSYLDTDPRDGETTGPRTVDRRRLLKTTGGVAAGTAFAGCLETAGSVVGSSDGADPVKIGLLAPDPDSDMIGRSMYRSAELAVKELNENNRLDGRQVELVLGDTNSSPQEARRQYQRLILDENVDVTTGVFASEALLGIIDDIAEQQTIHLTTGAATTKVSQMVREQYEDYKYHFRVGPNNDVDLGRMQIDFLKDMAGEVGWDSIALLAEDYEWTEKPWEVYQSRIEETGVDVALEERYPPAIDSFESRYDEVEAADADAIFITTAHTGTSALLDWGVPEREFDFGGIHVPMQLPAYYDLVGGKCQYGIGQTSATATSEITDKTQDFVNAYKGMHGGSNPVYTGYHTYDAIKLFAHTIEQEGTFDHEQLVPALEDVSFTGSAGTAEFYDQGTDVEGTPVDHDLVYRKEETIYFQWQETDDGEGRQEVIWPPEEATADYVTPSWLA